MDFEPKVHQQHAIDHIKKHPKAALFLDMGLGKTAVALTVAAERLYDQFVVNKVLVIAPKRAAESTWPDEKDKWRQFQHLRVSKILGTEKQRRAALAKEADLYVINKENVIWLITNYGKNWPFDMLILDELSVFKSASAKRWRAIRRVTGFTPYVIGLTGTPAPNGYTDLWAEIYLLDGGERLGKTLTGFRNTYFNPGARKGHIVYEWRLKPGAKEEIDRRIADICLSMSAEDWLTLPPVVMNQIKVRINPESRKLYEKFKKEKVLPLLQDAVTNDFNKADNAITGDTAGVVSNKLLQMANGAVYDDRGGVFHIHDNKLDALGEIIEGAQGQSILVFWAYKHDLTRMKARFPQARELKTAEDIKQWNTGEIPLLLCHPASAGHGLNLQTGGHIAVWFGLCWSLELYQQANARLHRQGQTERVIIHHLICEGTADEAVIQALDKKDATQRDLLTALKQYLRTS